MLGVWEQCGRLILNQGFSEVTVKISGGYSHLKVGTGSWFTHIAVAGGLSSLPFETLHSAA